MEFYIFQNQHYFSYTITYYINLDYSDSFLFKIMETSKINNLSRVNIIFLFYEIKFAKLSWESNTNIVSVNIIVWKIFTTLNSGNWFYAFQRNVLLSQMYMAVG